MAVPATAPTLALTLVHTSTNLLYLPPKALTLTLLSVRQVPLPAFALNIGWLERLHDKGTGVPYGIALAAAGLMLYPDTHLWTVVSGAAA